MGERLQKYLASAGVASRRASEKLIEAGRVTVNGTVATLGMSVEEGDRVLLDGKPVAADQKRIVILFYKPRGVICSSSDPEGRRTVQDFFTEIPERLYNIGRLDLNSEGLLLMTNDGDLCNKMTHPKFKVEKTYYAVCDGKLTAGERAQLINGVMLDDGMTAPARINYTTTNQKGDTGISITIHEGRNRQIRRMLEAVGHRTLRLKREGYGPLILGELKSGEWRYLTDSEVNALLKSAKA
jgi:pseudouridine synthase